MVNTPDFKNGYGWNPKNENYKDGNKSIGTIYLTGAGYVRRPFSGVGIDSQFGWEEMVWYKQPTRTRDFSFRNIDDIVVGLVARCEINVKYMNYDDFLALRKIVARERRFSVEFFNVDEGKWITRDMYCSESSRKTLFTLKQSLVGVVDCVIKFVGTNLDANTIVGTKTVTYHLNGGSGTTPAQGKYTPATQVTLATTDGIIAPSGTHFKCWSTMSGATVTGSYGAGQSITLWQSLDLYAQWESY